MYRGFVNRINLRINAIFNEIETIYNFDNGDEFEIAICKILIELLPEKYGVCRGHVITKNGLEAGDDIIIYDKQKFPLLRLLNEDSLWRKQFVPVEAVYAYIEAKNTLYINGNNDAPQSLLKAISQVSKVKLLERTPVPLGTLSNHVRINKDIQRAYGWPSIRNPIYGCILSRNLKVDSSSKHQKLKSKDIVDILATYASNYSDNEKDRIMPDMIIGGNDGLLVPAKDGEFLSPFHIKGITKTTNMNVKMGSAFGVGLVNLIYALNDIELNDIYWPEIISTAIDVELTNPRE